MQVSIGKLSQRGAEWSILEGRLGSVEAGKTGAKGGVSGSLAETFGSRAGEAAGGHTEAQTQSCVHVSGLSLQREGSRGCMEMTALF